MSEWPLVSDDGRFEITSLDLATGTVAYVYRVNRVASLRSAGLPSDLLLRAIYREMAAIHGPQQEAQP